MKNRNNNSNVCIQLFNTPSGVRTLSASGDHCNNNRDTQEHILLQYYYAECNSKQDHPGQEHYEQPYNVIYY